MDKCDTGEQGAMSACPESSDLSKEIVSRIIHSFESHVDKALAEEASNIPQANTPTLAGCGISGMNMGASAAPVSSPGQSTPPTPPSEPFRFVINLNLNNWGPIPGVGTSHLGLSCPLGYTQGVRYAAQSPEASKRSLEEARKSRAGKIKISQERRRSRRHGVSDLVSMAKDSYQGKQLRDAVSAEDEEAVERLLTSGVDANSPDSRQRYPLHIAAAKGNHKIARLLLNHGADPNVQDAIGNTPLHLASCTCQVPVITVLLNAGTDLRTLDTFGKTPLQLARGRLLLLKEDMSFSNEQLRSQVMEVVDMIMSYRVRQWHQERFGKDDQLEDLCSQFAQTSTREEVVDGVGNLLAHLDIARDSGVAGATGGADNDPSSSTSTAASATSTK